MATEWIYTLNESPVWKGKLIFQTFIFGFKIKVFGKYLFISMPGDLQFNTSSGLSPWVFKEEQPLNTKVMLKGVSIRSRLKHLKSTGNFLGRFWSVLDFRSNGHNYRKPQTKSKIVQGSICSQSLWGKGPFEFLHWKKQPAMWVVSVRQLNFHTHAKSISTMDSE